MSRYFWAGQCCLCGQSYCDEGGGCVVKRFGAPDSAAFVLFFCLDCLDDRLPEVQSETERIIKEENLVRF